MSLDWITAICGKVMQHHIDPQTFQYIIVDMDERSEEIKAWLVEYAIEPSEVSAGMIKVCSVRFDDPALAMIFKLRFM